MLKVPCRYSARALGPKGRLKLLILLVQGFAPQHHLRLRLPAGPEARRSLPEQGAAHQGCSKTRTFSVARSTILSAPSRALAQPAHGHSSLRGRGDQSSVTCSAQASKAFRSSCTCDAAPALTLAGDVVCFQRRADAQAELRRAATKLVGLLTDALHRLAGPVDRQLRQMMGARRAETGAATERSVGVATDPNRRWGDCAVLIGGRRRS